MITVNSFAKDGKKIVPIQVELTLWPGLPGIHFIGLADQHLKESALRIKSAIKASGFQFPTSQQIIVNLRPSHIKKNSKGVELAVAAGFLWESGQIPIWQRSQDTYVYGELSLSGEVVEPDDLMELKLENENNQNLSVLTGNKFGKNTLLDFLSYRISKLSDIGTPQEILPSAKISKFKRPDFFNNFKFSNQQAEIIEILATGGHSALFAGRAGSGKSTLVQAVSEFLPEPSNNEFQEIQNIHFGFGEPIAWRPLVKPHHSTPIMAMIGGGSIPFAGEISRAHLGVLILDELLEFSNKVQEALREPFEEKRMKVYRNGILKIYPANCQILGTTNLCPCGKWIPSLKEDYYCKYSRQKCRSHINRLSGPLLDRFEILNFISEMGKGSVSGEALLNKIKKSQNFHLSLQKSLGKNFKSSCDLNQDRLEKFALEIFQSEPIHSQRRRMAWLNVAGTLASIEQNTYIEVKHLNRAKDLTIVPYQLLLN